MQDGKLSYFSVSPATSVSIVWDQFVTSRSPISLWGLFFLTSLKVLVDFSGLSKLVRLCQNNSGNLVLKRYPDRVKQGSAESSPCPKKFTPYQTRVPRSRLPSKSSTNSSYFYQSRFYVCDGHGKSPHYTQRSY